MLHRACHIRDVPEKGTLLICLPSKNEVALFKIDGKVYAINNECPHMGGPLCDGSIENLSVTCPWHAWRFNIANGKCEEGDEDAITYPIRIEKENVFIEYQEKP